MKTCATPGCPTLVERGHCETHGGTKHKWDQKRTATKRVTGAKLQAMRQRLFQQEPLCRLCVAQGRFTVATIRDHIVPLAEGGTDDETNEQPVCQECHDAKARLEAMSGKQRAGGI